MPTRTITTELIKEASCFLELVDLNYELLLEKVAYKCTEYNNNKFRIKERRFCSPAGIMRLSIYYTKIHNCYLSCHAPEIAAFHFWEATETLNEEE